MPNRELIARAIITEDDCLLVNQGTHSQTSRFYYALPGGHVEDGETCTEALQRELQEELAIDCNVGDLCFVIEHLYSGRCENDAPRHELTMYFNVTAASIIQESNGRIISPEPTKHFCWLPIDSLNESALLPEISREFLQKYFSRQQTPRYAFQDNTANDNS